MINKLLSKKFGDVNSDRAIEQYAIWIGSLVFFMLTVTKLPVMDISEYQLVIGVILLKMTLILGLIAGHIVRK